jgi:acetoacetate decarboxylase
MTEEQARNHPGVLAGTHFATRSSGRVGGWRTGSILARRKAGLRHYYKHREAKLSQMKARMAIYRKDPNYTKKYIEKYSEQRRIYKRAYRVLSDKAIDYEIDSNAKRRAARAIAS